MSMTITDLFRQLLEQEHRNTLAALEAIPGARIDFVPWPGAMDMRRLALHIIGLEQQFIGGVMAGELVAGGSRRDRPEVQTPADLVAFCKEQHEAVRPLVAQLNDELMEREIPFKAPHGAVVMTAPVREFLFSKLLHHLVHHRGQLLTYIRLAGAPVPGLYGPALEQTPPMP